MKDNDGKHRCLLVKVKSAIRLPISSGWKFEVS